MNPMQKPLLLLTFWLILAAPNVLAEATPDKNSIKTSVSLSPHITELLYSAGAQDGLLGVSAYSNYPSAAAAKTIIGDAFHVNAELLLQLQPDVVFYWAGGTPQQTVEKLKSLQLNVHPVRIERLADIPLAIHEMASILGSDASLAVDDFMPRLQALRSQARTQQSALIQISDQPIYTVNGAHWMSEAIGVCGLDNVFADLATPSAAVTLESVVLRKPEVLVRTVPLMDDSPVAQWPDIPAIKNQRIAVLEADHFTRPTLRLMDAIDSLCQQLPGS